MLDCSLVFAWFFADESNVYADSVAAGLAHSEALVPSLWTLEVANTIVIGERRGRSTVAQATAFLSRLSSLPITVDEHTSLVAWSGALPLARENQLSAYDAAYLELAIREGLPIATLDERLKKAAKALGIAAHHP